MRHLADLARTDEEALSDRPTLIPDYDIESFAGEAADGAGEESTLDMPGPKLSDLLARSISCASPLPALEQEAILIDEEWVVADEPLDFEVAFDDVPPYPATIPAPALPALSPGALHIAVADVGARHFSVAAERVLSVIDGKTPVRAVAMRSGLPYGEAITALRELFQDNVIALN